MSNKSLPQKPAQNKNQYQLDLLDEKRAYVVIALTDKLSLAGKLVALNALAHYNSERGYSWASIPVVAKESGYSPTSTKSISPGFDEIEEVGAFRVVRAPPRKGSRKSSTNRCCPIMPWFRDEYERLRQAGKFEQDNDPFLDIRSDNGSDERQGSQPAQIGSETRSDRVQDPVRQGPQPDEENRRKGTDRTEQAQTNEAGCGEPVDADVSDHPQPKPVNDNDPEAKVEPWSAGKFLEYYPKGGNLSKISNALEEIRREGKTEFKDILRGASNYKKQAAGTEFRFVTLPENFLKERLWEGYQQVQTRRNRHMAI